jgi:hypothetical protein
MMLFKNNSRYVAYFYNVIFPKCSSLLLKLLKTVTSIYLCAFDPDRKILNMIHQTKPITIYFMLHCIIDGMKKINIELILKRINH